MTHPTYEIHCMLCGTEVGEIREGRFLHHRGCDRPVPVRGGRIRCCRCGGSLYLERADNLTARLQARVNPELARAS